MHEDVPTAPVSLFGATKVMSEMMVGAYAASHGLEVAGLRYFTAYRPRQRPDMALARFIEAAVADRPTMIYSDGRQVRDFTYVGGVVGATVAGAQQRRPGAAYSLASSNPKRS
jgi:nucleoside-diphosphate-sugar epimerase